MSYDPVKLQEIEKIGRRRRIRDRWGMVIAVAAVIALAASGLVPGRSPVGRRGRGPELRRRGLAFTRSAVLGEGKYLLLEGPVCGPAGGYQPGGLALFYDLSAPGPR